MIRRPPRSTLFPTRRSSDLALDLRLMRPDDVAKAVVQEARRAGELFVAHATRSRGGAPAKRSEEHTSELQSRSDLVCRLLLEKKKHDCSTPWQSTHPSTEHI